MRSTIISTLNLVLAVVLLLSDVPLPAVGFQVDHQGGVSSQSQTSLSSTAFRKEAIETIQTTGPTRTARRPRPSMSSPPRLYNAARIQRGQKFYQENMFAIQTSWAVTLGTSFADPEAASVLLFTKASDTPEKANQRYLRTLRDLDSWHTTDIFDPSSLGYKRLQAVKNMHYGAAASVVSDQQQQQPAQAGATKKNSSAGNCPFRPLAKKIVKISKSSSEEEGSSTTMMRAQFTQSIMASAQTGFVGTLAAAPELFGVHDTRGLDDFVYLWYVLGKELGIEDEYNTCSNLESVKSNTAKLFRKLSLEKARNDPKFLKLIEAFCDGATIMDASTNNNFVPLFGGGAATPSLQVFSKEQIIWLAYEVAKALGEEAMTTTKSRKNNPSRMNPISRLRIESMLGALQSFGRLPSWNRRQVSSAISKSMMDRINKKYK